MEALKKKISYPQECPFTSLPNKSCRINVWTPLWMCLDTFWILFRSPRQLFHPDVPAASPSCPSPCLPLVPPVPSAALRSWCGICSCFLILPCLDSQGSAGRSFLCLLGKPQPDSYPDCSLCIQSLLQSMDSVPLPVVQPHQQIRFYSL